MTARGRQNLRAKLVRNWCAEDVHLSRGYLAKDAGDVPERALAAVRFHSNDLFKDVMIHEGEPGSVTLVTRRFDDCDGIWLMTETESYRHFGSHETPKKFGRTLGDGIAKGAENIGCTLMVLGVLGLIAWVFYLLVQIKLAGGG